MKMIIDTKRLTPLFKALGEANRMAILEHLCCCSKSGKEHLTVGEISGCCDVDLSVVSRHLGQLKKAGVLSAEKCGKEVRYSINSVALAGALRELADAIESCCQNRECCTAAPGPS